MRRLALMAATVLLLAACGGDDGTEVTDPGADDGATAPVEETETDGTDDAGDAEEDEAAGQMVLTTADSDLGTILVDGEGMTLYVFDNDSDGESSCYDSCAETWPPFTGEVSAEGEVDASLMGTTERDDGTTQVTYNDMPLYYYAPDSASGDTNGQGVGDVWWVIGPDGEKITDASASAGPYEDGY